MRAPALRRVAGIEGAAVEHNKFCVSVHFRNCRPDAHDAVLGAVEATLRQHAELHATRGRKVFEIRPQVGARRRCSSISASAVCDMCLRCLWAASCRTAPETSKEVRKGCCLMVSGVSEVQRGGGADRQGCMWAQVDWDKGSAVLHLLGALGLAGSADCLPLYIGDDRTDEDAFRALARRAHPGIGILVSSKVPPA
jgi:hypothetical protein